MNISKPENYGVFQLDSELLEAQDNDAMSITVTLRNTFYPTLYFYS